MAPVLSESSDALVWVLTLPTGAKQRGSSGGSDPAWFLGRGERFSGGPQARNRLARGRRLVFLIPGPDFQTRWSRLVRGTSTQWDRPLCEPQTSPSRLRATRSDRYRSEFSEFVGQSTSARMIISRSVIVSANAFTTRP